MARNPGLRGALGLSMDKLIRHQDLKSVLLGAAGVAAVGLLCGAAMQPNLRAPGEVEGPQMQAGTSGQRDYAARDAGAAWTGYRNGIPDYVIGVDWLQPAHEAEDLPVYDDSTAPDVSDYAAPAYAPAVATIHEEPARTPPLYPSMAGGTAYAAQENATEAVGVEPMETALDPDMAELAVATPG